MPVAPARLAETHRRVFVFMVFRLNYSVVCRNTLGKKTS
jgi:hypothetical protein